MSEKRILIKEVTVPCNGCSGAGEKVCDNCYDYWHVWNSCLTREQAIEKMAKTICNWYYTECNECAIKDKPKECKAFLKDSDFYEQAEKALNAVLECKTMESKIK